MRMMRKKKKGTMKKGKNEERERDIPSPKSISYETKYFPNQKRSERKIFNPTWEIIPLRPIYKGKRFEIRIK